MHEIKKNHQAVQEIWLVKELCDLIGQEPETPKSQESKFSQTCEWCTILPNHNVHHFSPFPAKTNDSILRKRPEVHF